MFKKLLLVFLLVFPVSARESDPLVKYIREGLQNNLALQQKEFSLQQSLSALKEARGMFLPSLAINARYTRAGGGRDIIFPVGDLLNPVYQSINQILTSLGQSPRPFPTLKNEVIPFLREEEHDTRLTLIQPLFQPALYHNYRIRDRLSKVKQAERDAFARQLVADIKSAYFTHLKTLQIRQLLNDTEALLRENLRISKKLAENGLATRDVPLRAQAEFSVLKQQQANAEKNVKISAAWFNFLLNRALDATIDTIGNGTVISPAETDLPAAQHQALKLREELRQMDDLIAAATGQVSLGRSKYLPGLVLAANYGFEGEKYKFTKKDDYWQANLILNWNLFNGFQDEAKVEQAQLAARQLAARREILKKQIALQVREAWYSLKVSEKNWLATREQLRAESKAFEITRKKFEQGMAPQIEFLDARNRLTRSAIGEIVAKFDHRIAQATMERATAAFNLTTENSN